MYIFSCTEHNRKLKFSLQTHLTHINTIFEYCYGAVKLDNEDDFHLEDVNVHKTRSMFFLILNKPFRVKCLIVSVFRAFL